MATTKEPTVAAAATESTASESHSESAAPATKFTSKGQVPPVAPLSDERAPSASDRAFGGGDAAKAAPTKAAPATVDGFLNPTSAKMGLENPTWDPNAVAFGTKDRGAWVEATAQRNADGTKSDVTGEDGKTSSVDKRMVAGTTIDPAQRSANLEAGRVDDEQLKAITPAQVAQINPLGQAPRNILKHALHESWHHAKHVLLAPGENAPARQMLMAKLWEFRQWHHHEILRRTQLDASVGKDGLTEWKEAGSTTLTSDIDVNLKGAKTELAVGVFNRLFKADGWSKESGVVYDVNVYALDFMHKETFKPGLADEGGTIKEHTFTKDDTATRVSAKEGVREGNQGGGVGTHSQILEQRMVKADADLQRVWSLVKMRFYMTGAQWTEYTQSAAVPASTLAQVDLRYDAYMTELQDRIAHGTNLVREADTLNKTGAAVVDSLAKAKGRQANLDAEDVKMGASNRIYEAKLLEMAGVREKVKTQIALRQEWLKAHKAADAEALDAAIDGNLAILRDLICECSMFANEGYVTDGGVNHAVVGLQSKVGISQTKAESMDAFNENAADVLKEVARHNGSIGEAAYKAGKYMWRMADAAQNLGVKDKDIDALFTAGYTLANKIKGSDGATQEQLEQKAGAALIEQLGAKASTPDALMDFIRTLAARIAKQHAANLDAHGQERGAAVTATR